MASTFDAVILGAGHNALILSTYLGRAGLSSICLERAEAAGGGLTTVEIPLHSGFLHNTHSFYHRGVTSMPWYRDLALEARGAEYLQPEPNVALITSGGDVLSWWSDAERTAETFARFSRRDAESLRRWRDDFVPIVENILVPESAAPPLPEPRRSELLAQSALGRRLLEVSALSPVEFVRGNFEHPVVRAGLLFFNGLREVDLREPGFGHHVPSLLASPARAQMCRGGSHGLAKALLDAATETGGEIATGVTPRRIVFERGRAAGVLLADGSLIHARRLVASSLNPQQTFLDLMEPADVPPPWRRQAEAFQYNLVAPLFGLHVNLTDAPLYTAANHHPEIQDALMVILGLDDDRQFDEIVAHHQRGTIPPTVMWGSCPSRHDPAQAPSGGHTAFMWEKAPYRLAGDPQNWDARKDEHAAQMLQVWRRYAPNLASAVTESFARSPLDVELALPNMRYGDLLVGAFSGGQVGADRPFPGAGQYRGHAEGLYLCGSCCHPGGNITGLPGYNSAQVILADLGIPADWAPPPIEDRLAGLAG